MKKTQFTKLLSAIVCIVLIAAMALCMTACNDNTTTDPVSLGITETAPKAETKFTFGVVDVEGKETSFEISTDKTIVGDALLEEGLIAGEDSEYGLYVKTVNGITLDYDKDGKYWAFYVDGAYASAGVDTTEIESGATYSFKAE